MRAISCSTFFADDHHHIGKFINHYYYIGQGLQQWCLWRLLAVVPAHFIGIKGPQRIANGVTCLDGIFNFAIVPGQVSDTHGGHQFVASLHLAHTPAQAASGIFHVGDHWGQ